MTSYILMLPRSEAKVDDALDVVASDALLVRDDHQQCRPTPGLSVG